MLSHGALLESEAETVWSTVMKYMGSKAAMLRGRLGPLLQERMTERDRFVDLFSGSASVTHFMAQSVAAPVLSVDLQTYSSVLAASVTDRTVAITEQDIATGWVKRVSETLAEDDQYMTLAEPLKRLGRATVERARRKSGAVADSHFITKSYGGFYFSSQQAYALDALIRNLPADGYGRTVGLAALIRTASVCAAAPGHTAQPFQPTARLIPYIRSAWERDVFAECQSRVEQISGQHALVKGATIIGGAESAINEIKSTDLVFCDPPYSAVQYSRFYHALEGIALGGWASVGGAGRAPAIEERRSSDFSMKGKAHLAMTELLTSLRDTGSEVVITFPDVMASNGLSAVGIAELAKKDWQVQVEKVATTHSTMGGSSVEGGRGGRRKLEESIILLSPK